MDKRANSATVDFIILMGPPGAGKTYLAKRLRDEHACRYSELEPQLLARFGTGPEFAQNKRQALQFTESALRAQHAHAGRPVIVESTGLSDRDILLRLQRDFRLLFVKVLPAVETCVARVERRAAGANLNNDPAFARSFHEFWQLEVATQYEFDLCIRNETEDTEAGLAAIVRLLATSE